MINIERTTLSSSLYMSPLTEVSPEWDSISVTSQKYNCWTLKAIAWLACANFLLLITILILLPFIVHKLMHEFDSLITNAIITMKASCTI